MRIYKRRFKEDIVIPLNKNDKFYWGKFKNKTAIVDRFDVNEKGDPVIITDTGKIIPLLKIRLMKESLLNEKSIKELSADIVELYHILKQKKMKITAIVKKIADDMNVAENIVLQVLQQSENKKR